MVKIAKVRMIACLSNSFFDTEMNSPSQLPPLFPFHTDRLLSKRKNKHLSTVIKQFRQGVFFSLSLSVCMCVCISVFQRLCLMTFERAFHTKTHSLSCAYVLFLFQPNGWMTKTENKFILYLQWQTMTMLLPFSWALL